MKTETERNECHMLLFDRVPYNCCSGEVLDCSYILEHFDMQSVRTKTIVCVEVAEFSDSNYILSANKRSN